MEGTRKEKTAHSLRNDVAPPGRYPSMFATLFRYTMTERNKKSDTSQSIPSHEDPDLDGGMIKTAVEDASGAVGGVIVTAAVAAYATSARVSNTMLGALKTYNVL